MHRNGSGNRGCPCSVPLLTSNLLLKRPDNLIWAVESEYIFHKVLNIFSLKPSLEICRNSTSLLSAHRVKRFIEIDEDCIHW